MNKTIKKILQVISDPSSDQLHHHPSFGWGCRWSNDVEELKN